VNVCIQTRNTSRSSMLYVLCNSFIQICKNNINNNVSKTQLLGTLYVKCRDQNLNSKILSLFHVKKVKIQPLRQWTKKINLKNLVTLKFYLFKT
jgi:hypothetical protein